MLTRGNILKATLIVGLLAAGVPGCREINRAAAVRHYEQGKLLADRREYDEALAELKRAIAADPDMSVAYAAVGDIQLKRGNLDDARGAYESACRTNPYAFRPHYNLGVTYQMLAEAARAADTFRKHMRRAVYTYVRAVTLEPSDFDTNLNLGACYFQLGKYELAEKYCRAAIRLRGDSPEAYNNLGIICDARNRLYEAIQAYKQSLELDTDQPQLLVNLGSTYLRQGRVRPALVSFRQAADRSPEWAAPWEQMGICHYHLEDLDAAEEAYRTALGLDPDSAVAHRGLGVVYMNRFIHDRTRGELRDKALAAWNASLEIDPHQDDLVRLVRKYSPKQEAPQL